MNFPLDGVIPIALCHPRLDNTTSVKPASSPLRTDANYIAVNFKYFTGD